MSCSYLCLNLNKTLPPLQGQLLLLRRDKNPVLKLFPLLLHTNSQGVLANTAAAIKASQSPPPHAHQYFMSGASHKIPKLTPWFVCFLLCRIQFIQSFWLIHCPCTYIKAVNILQGRVFRQGPDAACDAAAEQRDASPQDGPALGLENK